MRTVIVGAGAVGLALGSCLHRAGHPVHFVLREGARSRPLLARSGLRRSGLFGEVRVPASELRLSRMAELSGEAIDAVVVCTKTTANVEVIDALADVWPRLAGDPVVVVCQNGWGNAERFAERLPRDRVYSARVITGFRLEDEASVEVTVHADSIRIGSLFGADRGAVWPLAQAIAAGGIPCETTDTIGRDLWAKVLYNCLLNPLSALLRVRYGVLAQRPGTRALMERIAGEIFSVMAAAGHATHWRRAEDYLADFYAEILPPTAAHESSMLQDLNAGRRSEIDALCGAVTRLGEQAGVETPVNHALAVLVRAAEQRGAGAGS